MKHGHDRLFDLIYGRERIKAEVTLALGSLGPQALPYLTNELAATNSRHRVSVLESIAKLSLHGTPTNACLIPLLSATTDTDPRVRRAATNYIQRLAPEALANRPGTAPELPASALSQ